jgi:hypothetical protein
MRISIKYEASWRNSFLDGSNNEPLPKGGRGFVGSMKSLAERENEQFLNFKKREVTIDTVMGVLNRLIGDQRKLYQSRANRNYFFSELESKVTFEDQQDKFKPINTEIVYIRNITGSTDQNAFTGMIKSNDPIFCSSYSDAFWGVLTLGFQDLCQFIYDSNFSISNKEKFDPLSVLATLAELNKLKPVVVSGHVFDALTTLRSNYPDANYLDSKDMIKPIMFYCSALYLQVGRLTAKGYDLSTELTKTGGVSGISKRGFTPKDFMDRYTTGPKKPIWGNPYVLKEKRKGEGEVISILRKANGTLEINLDIPQDKAQELNAMIEAAGVSSFYLGKKGLAYVEDIRI